MSALGIDGQSFDEAKARTNLATAAVTPAARGNLQAIARCNAILRENLPDRPPRAHGAADVAPNRVESMAARARRNLSS